MSDDGYTAVEALAALLILGLALGGLFGGMRVIGRVQAAAIGRLTDAAAARAAGTAVSQLVASQGPFRSDAAAGFQGEESAFNFPCGAVRCEASIEGDRLVVADRRGARMFRLPEGPVPTFRYASDQGQSARWPPAPSPPPAPRWQTLRSISLARHDGAHPPMAVIRLWVQQSADCDFDVVVQDCRTPAS